MNNKYRILIFDYLVSGHHLEYLNHLYKKALQYQEKKFIFVLPLNFTEVKDKLSWPDAINITIHLEDFSKINKTSGLIKSFRLSQLLKSNIKKFKITHIFLISLMSFLPTLPFIMNSKVKISGIIYLIYLYRWKNEGSLPKLQDAFKYLLFTKMKSFHEIFILNDALSARYLNIKFKTNKFKYLPDPFIPIPEDKIKNIREKLNILPNKTVFLHFGGLSRRKGTIDILEALELLPTSQLDNLCFIFAGKVYDDISTEFYEKLNKQKERVQILCFDEFCEYTFLGSLCLSCDFILIPYKATAQSSGALGFAAQFNKPVIAPNDNLLGKLVRKFNLGFTIKNITPKSLSLFIKEEMFLINKSKKSDYLRINSIENFTNSIFSKLTNKQETLQ